VTVQLPCTTFGRWVVFDIVVCHVDCLVCQAIMPLGLCNSFAACWGRAARAVVQPSLHIDAIVGWHHTFTPLRGGITHSRHCGVASLRKGEGKPILADTRAMPLILRGGRGMLVLPFLVLFCFTSYHSQRGDYHYFRFADHFVFRTFCPCFCGLCWRGMLCHALLPSHRVDSCGIILVCLNNVGTSSNAFNFI
jgi:hypothetical protein